MCESSISRLESMLWGFEVPTCALETNHHISIIYHMYSGTTVTKRYHAAIKVDSQRNLLVYIVF